MTKMQKYTEMKDSGVEWIGEVPKGWNIGRVKQYTVKIGSGKTPKGGAEVYSDHGVIFLRSQNVYNEGLKLDEVSYITEEIDAEMTSTHVFPNDVLLNITGGSIGRCCLYPPNMPLANVNQHVCILRADQTKILPALLCYIWQSNIGENSINVNQTGANREGMNFEQIRNTEIPIMKMSEQQAIAAYLDDKCAAIDDVIAGAKSTIEEYKAWKASVIFEAVTKGLDPNAEMKDSGVEWIGQIPKWWNLVTFNRCATIKSNLVAPEKYGNLPQISPEHIEKGSGKLLPTYKSVSESGVISWNHLFTKGQLIYSKVRPALNKLFIAPFDGLCSADMYPIEVSENIKYIAYSMLSESFVQQVASITANRVKMPKINQNELAKILVILPPLPEQAAIAAYLDDKCAAIDGIIAEKEALITELESYKKSLIFETVTGKRRVC